MPQTRAAVILAAGKGTRMRSALPKVLHAVGGRSMLAWSVAAARGAGVGRIVVVTGHGGAEVEAAAKALGCETAVQAEQLGTGHAVLSAKAALAAHDGPAIVLFADTPLIRPETLEAAFAAVEEGAGVAVVGFEAEAPGAYGRLVEGEGGDLLRIVEAADASPQELDIALCNSGVMAAKAKDLVGFLAEVKNDNKKGEYYLTDVVAVARRKGRRAAIVRGDESEVLGVNSRVDLATAEAAFQARTRLAALEAGVTMIDPATVWFAHDTVLAPDVVIEPNVMFGPGVTVESGVVLHAFSHLEGAVVRAGASIGPFARLRPGTDIGPKAKVGNFVELKKTTMGPGAKASHLTYLGDATVGAKANLGAGTITCNYDGFNKAKTVIGEGAFIGSDTALVAPVTVGAGAFTAAGSVIVEDVPADALAVARGRQANVEGWSIRFRAKNAGAKKAEGGSHD